MSKEKRTRGDRSEEEEDKKKKEERWKVQEEEIEKRNYNEEKIKKEEEEKKSVARCAGEGEGWTAGLEVMSDRRTYGHGCLV